MLILDASFFDWDFDNGRILDYVDGGDGQMVHYY
jgi:hypothetical protein